MLPMHHKTNKRRILHVTGQLKTAKESYNKMQEKAQHAYAVVREKARALYKKAKENKLITTGMTYLALEASLLALGEYTLLSRIFWLPKQLNTANNVTIPGLNTQIGNLTRQFNAADANLNIANGNIANLNDQIIHLQNNQHHNPPHNVDDLKANPAENDHKLDNTHQQDPEEIQQQYQEVLQALSKKIKIL